MDVGIYILEIFSPRVENYLKFVFIFSYLRPVKVSQNIIIEAETLKVGKSLAYLAVQIKEESSGKLVATGEHIKFVG